MRILSCASPWGDGRGDPPRPAAAGRRARRQKTRGARTGLHARACARLRAPRVEEPREPRRFRRGQHWGDPHAPQPQPHGGRHLAAGGRSAARSGGGAGKGPRQRAAKRAGPLPETEPRSSGATGGKRAGGLCWPRRRARRCGGRRSGPPRVLWQRRGSRRCRRAYCLCSPHLCGEQAHSNGAGRRHRRATVPLSAAGSFSVCTG